MNENEIPDLNSLKPFEFESKTTSEILTEVAVMMRKKVLNMLKLKVLKRISNSERCDCSAKLVVGRCSSK